jgi:hypothetical protein
MAKEELEAEKYGVVEMLEEEENYMEQLASEYVLRREWLINYYRKTRWNAVMENLYLRVPYKLNIIIEVIAKKILENGIGKQLNYKEMNFCLYTKEYEELASEDTFCYLDDYPYVDDDDKEVYPPFVIETKLEYYLSGENLEAVVGNALNQKADVSVAEFIIALNYYLAHDAFMQL